MEENPEHKTEEKTEQTFKHLKFDHEPPASNGLMLAALDGPHNAGLSATTALGHLMEQAGATRFAQIYPDAVFTYDQNHPQAEMDRENGSAQVYWPHLEFRHSAGEAQPGPAFLTGKRPQLRMLEFTRMIGEAARRCGASTVINITSGFGQRAHPRPTTISAAGVCIEETPRLQEVMELIRADPRTDPRAAPLQDPALIHACLTQGLAYVSVCGHVPQYLAVFPNHQVSLELVQLIRQFTGTGHGTGKPEQQAGEFRQALETIMASSPAIREIVRAAEQQEDDVQARRQAGLENTHLENTRLENIDPEEMAGEVERFLQSEREKNGGNNA